MSQSDGIKELKRMMLKDEERDVKYPFTLNPQTYEYTRPQRVSALKTVDRVVVEDFNSDIATLVITGHTGFDKGNGEKKIKALKSILDKYSNEKTSYGANPKKTLLFYNFTDDDYFHVHPAAEGVKFRRDVESPLFYHYTLTFYVLGRIGEYGALSKDYIGDAEVSTDDENSAATPDDKPPSDKNPDTGKSETESNNPGGQVPQGTRAMSVDAKNGYTTALLASMDSGSTRLRETVGVV